MELEQQTILEVGEIALEGPAAQLADDPKVIESYLGLGGAAHVASTRAEPDGTRSQGEKVCAM